MRTRTRSRLASTLSLLLVAALALGACDDDGGESTADTTTGTDTSAADTGADDTSAADTGADDTTAGDTAGDTGTGDTSPADGDDVAMGAPLIHEAGLCTVPAEPGLSVAPGEDLWRVTIDTAAYPEALCNDGTPGVFYVSPAPAGSPDADKWIVWLEGGSGCNDGTVCADRWCGRQSIYTAAKMSSRWAPTGIRGVGLFDREPGTAAMPRTNNFAGYNHVVAYYCSSDNWSGTGFQEVTDAAGTPYAIHIKGARIVDALFDLLQQGVASDGSEATMPDLDDASQVIFAGTSAGSGGVRFNVDRVGELLAASNPDVDYRLVVDAGFYPSDADPPHITEETAQSFLDLKWDVFTQFRASIPDASCMAFHADDPRLCADNAHLLVHHTSTPWFVKMDLTDPVNAPGLYPDTQTFAMATHRLLSDLAAGTITPEESDAQAFPIGIFAPNCAHHVNLEAGAFYNVGISTVEPGPTLSNHDVLWNWISGTSPMIAIHNPPEGVESVCP